MSGRMEVIRADARQYHDEGWLRSHRLLPPSGRQRFGALRAFNDDRVLPGNGYPERLHRDMEIITIVYRGRLTHRDDQGNHGIIGTGGVQRMSAGTGVAHTETNEGDEEVHLHRIWIDPSTSGVRPSYAKASFSPETLRNDLFPLASGRVEAAVTMNGDATVHLSELKSGTMVTLELGEGRGAFIYLTHGAVAVNGEGIGAFDQARLTQAPYARIKALKDSRMVVIDVPMEV